MEDDEEASSNINRPSLEKLESRMEHKPLETEELTNTQQCDFVPEFVPEMDDSQLVGAKSSIVAKEDELMLPEEKTPLEDVKVETEKGLAISAGGKSIPELHDSQIVGVEPPIAAEDAKDYEAVTQEEILHDCQIAGAEPAIAAEDTKDDEAVAREEILHHSQIVGAERSIAAEGATDDEAVAHEEIPTADTQMVIDTKAEVEAEASKGSGGDPKLHDSQQVGSQSLIAAKEVEDVEAAVEEEIPMVGTKMEMEANADAEVEAKAAKGSEGAHVAELNDSQVVGVESLIVAKDDEDHEVAEEEIQVDTKMETETEVEADAAKGAGRDSVPALDYSQLAGAVSPIVAEDDEEEAVAAEEAPTADTEMETETDAVDSGKGIGGKRKRGRNSRVPVKAPARKTIEEDVCFICFDGGDLVLCDRRGCPKAYHPSCINRDEAFFRAKGRWNCGWHLCSKCEKNAYYMCYTCTFSLCKGCIKDGVILCVRGNKGFCETCMKTVMLIENNEQGNKEGQVDFDDSSSWEYLFKDYFIDLKANLSLSSVELAQAKNSWKGSDVLAGKQESPDEQCDANYDGASGSDKSSEDLEASKSKRRKAKKRSKSLTKEEDSTSAATAVGAEGTSTPLNLEWASKELLEFVMHMKNGDKSVLSQFDVQALLLEYIKRNKLRDPRRKSQIICDSRLENLFGKARVGHFEMLKLIESHFLIKEDSQMDDVQGSVVDTEINQVEADGNIDTLMKGGKDRKRKMRKKGDGRGPQSNLDDYAAIDIHNINLIYLRRKLMEDLLEDIEKFHDKVVGTFVRIRISGSNQKQDIYRLVQVVGTSKAPEPYKIGRRTTDIVLEILNLNKTEVISIDTISNQEFTEDECKRLRQSIKCGLINRLTVGDVLDKAMEVQAARVNDWLETEVVRLSHLRDRASEKGRRKELRECVEKLQLLKTPEERRRRLEEIPEIHADPNMDPSYESEEDGSEMDDNRRDVSVRPRVSGFSMRGREPVSPGRGDFSSKDSWSGTKKNSSKNWELNRTLSSKNLSNKGEDATAIGETPNENSWNQGRDGDTQQSNNLEKPSSATNSETVGWNSHSVVRSELFSGVASDTSPASLAAGVAETTAKISETDKMWHYEDPSGKIQGPFSIVQLRKWSNTGYFPVDLKIWRATEKQDDSLLLTDALAGRFQKELLPVDNKFPKASTLHSSHLSSTHAGKPYETPLQQVREGQYEERLSFDQNHGAQISNSNLVLSSQSPGGNWSSQPDIGSSRSLTTTPIEVPKDRWGSDHGSRNDSLNLPSPTPKQYLPSPTPKQRTAGWTGGEAGPLMGASSFPDGNGTLQSPAAATPNSGKFTHSSASSSVITSGIKEHNAVGSLSILAPISVMNSGGQLTRGSENDSSISLSGFSQAPNSDLRILVGSTNSLRTSQSSVTSESHGVQMHSHVLPASDAASHMVQSVNSQNPPLETHGWGSAPSQKLEPTSAIPVPVQPLAYGHWGGVVPTSQNPAGNFSTPGHSALPQPDPWRPSMPGNQSNMQPPGPPNVPWGMGVGDNNSSTPGLRPDNPNTGWGTIPGIPNMGWGGPAQGSTNMNWGATVQGPSPGNANPGWVVPAGNPGATVQGPVTGNVNQGWVAPTGNPGAIVQGLAPGNANPGWATPIGNMGATVQGPLPGNGNLGWVAPSGNAGATVQGPAAGNANPGWGTPAGNQGVWGSEQHRNGDRFLGQRDRGSHGGDSGFSGGRPWNRQSSFGGGGAGGSSRPLPRAQRVCVFHENGHCKKGASCDYMHT